MKPFVLSIGLMLTASAASGQLLNLFGCPTITDLDDGILISDPARIGVLTKRYRRLEGPLIGINYVNGINPNGTTVSYSGLFTYMAWRNGELFQIEEPSVDLSRMLKFETGTIHDYSAVRYNPQKPSSKWFIESRYKIEEVDDFQLGNCNCPAIRILREGTLTLPSGETRRDRQNYIFVPELLLRVAGTGVYFGDISAVRKRTIIDGRNWPFSADPENILRP